MRKIFLPKNTFVTKAHSASPTVLAKWQKEIFSSSNLVREQKLAEILSAETRLQVLFLLSRQSSLCVSDIAATLRVSISAISHQLKWLRQERLVITRKKGRVVRYGLSTNLPTLVKVVLAKAQS